MDLYNKLKNNKYFDYFEIKKQYEKKGQSREELLQGFEELKPFIWKYENPFMHIRNFENKFFDMFSEGDKIVIQEKIDGSNTHIHVSDNEFKSYSNSCILNEKNHLQGFWYWCKEHYTQIPDKYWGIDIYGEWLVPHHCKYPADKYGQFYVFDVMENGEYWPQERVELLARECGFEYAPVLFNGTFQSWKHIMSFVGQSKLGAKTGEGTVIKNQTTLNSSTKEFYVKIVDIEFQETNKSRQVIKTVNMDKVLEMEEELLLSKSIVTLPRVRKIILKLVDSHELPATWNELDDIDLLRSLKPYVFKDCVKEEKEITDKIGKKFGKYCNDLTLNAIQALKKDS